MKRKDLIDQLVSEIEKGKVRTLGIYGHGASGKSTFAQELYQSLDSTTVNLLETDPYITSGRYLVVPKDAPNQKVTACLPVAHELASLERDILALQAGMDILTIEEPWKASEILSGAKPILIVEGMSVGFLPKELFDKTICFYTDEDTELKRRLARDTTVRNRDGRTPTCNGIDSVKNLSFTFQIDVCSGFIEQKDWGVFDECPGKCDALRFTAR